jgi:alpha-beta hydrolase superfamily lysophospholipase
MPIKKLPDFFSQFKSFISAIPQLKPEHSNASRADKISANASLERHLKSYLDFYNINFMTDKVTRKNIARSYKIWQSQILGYRIVEQCWQPKQFNGQTLFIVHGYFEHTGLYQNIIFWSLQNGYNVHVFDLPGHGLSSGKAADIDSFNTYGNILTAIVKREHCPNYSLLGQSTGGAVIINALLSPTPTAQMLIPKNIILLSPLVRSRHWQQTRWRYYLLRRFISSIKRSFPTSSHDHHFNNFLKNGDPLQAQRLPLAWLGAMDDWIQQIATFKKNTQQPCWLIQGTGDKTVDYKYNLKAIKRCLPQLKIEMIAGAAHNLINENDEYWQQVSALLSKAHLNLPISNAINL